MHRIKFNIAVFSSIIFKKDSFGVSLTNYFQYARYGYICVGHNAAMLKGPAHQLGVSPVTKTATFG